MRTLPPLALTAALAAACSAGDPPPVIEPDASLDVAPTDVAPLDVAPSDVAPSDVAPSDVAPPDVAPPDVALTDVAPSARLPRGHLDNADCRGLWGWALDDDAPDVALAVRARAEGVDLTGVADGPRPDVCAPRPGPCNHGFSLDVPAALRDGRDHAVTVFARDAADGREAVIAAGTLRCGDAGGPPADATVDAAPDVPAAAGDDRIQTEITQECTDGDGVTFRARPTHPTRGPDGYTFAWRVTDGSARLSLNGARDRAHVVLVGDGVPNHTHLELTISRPGYRTLVVPPALLWSSACAHEFNPTSCPENLRSLAASAEFVARGQALTVSAPEAPAGDVNWYANQGLDGVTYDAASHTMRATVTNDPAAAFAMTQAQPGSDARSPDTARCHGWTQRYWALR